MTWTKKQNDTREYYENEQGNTLFYLNDLLTGWFVVINNKRRKLQTLCACEPENAMYEANQLINRL